MTLRYTRRREMVVSWIVLLFAVPLTVASQMPVDQSGDPEALAPLNLVRLGADGRGRKDASEILSAALASACSTGRRLYIPRGLYRITRPVIAACRTGTFLDVDAEPGALLDARSLTEGPYAVFLHGTEGSAGRALDSDVRAGARVLRSEAAGAVSPGDILQVLSSAKFDPSLPKGEMAEVATVAGNVITLTTGLLDSYAAATTTVRVLPMVRVHFANLELAGNSSAVSAGLFIQYARDLHLEGVTATGFQERSIYVDHVYHGVIDRVRVSDMRSTAEGTNYGVFIGSSQYVSISNSYVMGGRAAIDVGGREPGRFIQIGPGNIVGRLPSSAVGAIDLHGDAEFVDIFGNTIFGGVTSAARTVRVRENPYIDGSPAVYIEPTSPGDFQRVEHNVLRNCGIGILFSPLEPIAVAEFVAEGNDIACSGNAGILFQGRTGETRLDRAILIENRIAPDGAFGIRVAKNSSATLRISEMRISGGFVAPKKGGPGVALFFDPTLPPVTDLVILGAEIRGQDGGTSIRAKGGVRNIVVSESNLSPADGSGRGTCLNVTAAAGVRLSRTVCHGWVENGGLDVSASGLFLESVDFGGASGQFDLHGTPLVLHQHSFIQPADPGCRFVGTTWFDTSSPDTVENVCVRVGGKLMWKPK